MRFVDVMPRPVTGHRLLILACYGVLAALVTWPLPLQLNSHLLGHPDVDVWNHAWGFWWFKHTLLEDHRLPFFTRYLAYPVGGRLFFIDPLNAFISIPFQLCLGLVPAYNLTLLLELSFTGIAMHALARQMGCSPRAALLAGTLLMTSPYLRCEMHNGITEVGNLGWLVLAVSASLQALSSGHKRAAIKAGLLSGLAFVACWYYGLAMGFFLICLVSHRLICARPTWTDFKQAFLPSSLFALSALAVSAPFFAAFQWTLEGDHSMIKRGASLSSFLLRHNATDLLSFFHPGQFYSPDLWLEHGERFLHSTYLGFLPLSVALVGCLRPQARSWTVFGLFFALLSLGPFLFMGGQHLSVGGFLVPLPFALLSYGIKLTAITHPSRMVVGALVSLALVMGMGLDWLEQRFQRVRSVFFPVGLAVLLVEMLLFAPGPYPVSLSSASLGDGPALMRLEPSPGAVLDLPVQSSQTMRTSRYLYLQTFHQRPTPYVVNVRAQSTPYLHQSLLYQWARALPNATDESLPGRIHAIPVERWASTIEKDFRRAGYRFIVLHQEISSPPFGIWPYRRMLDQVLGPPTVTSEGALIYRIPPLTTEAMP